MFSVVRVPNALPPHIMMTIFRHCPFPSFLPQKMKDPSGCFKSERFGSKVATYLVLLKAALIWWWTAAKCSPSQNTSFRCVVLFSNILTVFNKKADSYRILANKYITQIYIWIWYTMYSILTVVGTWKTPTRYRERGCGGSLIKHQSAASMFEKVKGKTSTRVTKYKPPTTTSPPPASLSSFLYKIVELFHSLWSCFLSENQSRWPSD